jgi:antitoxin (DNA-binding transcriptional repressor) of toxin-antitoxin stability system
MSDAANEARSLIRVTIQEAERDLPKLAAQAQAGEEIVLTRGGEAVARIVGIATARPRRRAGRLKGLIDFDERFFEPLPEEELRLWEGR